MLLPYQPDYKQEQLKVSIDATTNIEDHHHKDRGGLECDDAIWYEVHRVDGDDDQWIPINRATRVAKRAASDFVIHFCVSQLVECGLIMDLCVYPAGSRDWSTGAGYYLLHREPWRTRLLAGKQIYDELVVH